VNPWHDVRLLNTAANGLMALAIVGLLGAGVWWLIQRPAFALRTVVIEPAVPEQGLQHVSSALLRSSGAIPTRGNFFSVNLDAVRERFEAVPWVRRADVRRVWPNTLRVGIEEHQPLAVWSDGRLVNRQGELFTANVAEADSQADLLQFSGPPGSEQQVTRRWQALRSQLAPLKLEPEAVSLSNRYAWSARLDNGLMLLLGREQDVPIDERVNRWVAAYPQALTRLNREVVSVDLRYPTGFAMRAPGAIERRASDTPARPGVVPTQAVPRPVSGTRPSTESRRLP
jgi:cell division protein FtsQ